MGTDLRWCHIPDREKEKKKSRERIKEREKEEGRE